MSRVYQSRGLIDPNMYRLMSDNMNERIRQDRESRRPVIEMLQGAIAQGGKSIDEAVDQLGRDRYLKRVMEENPEFAEYAKNPFFKASMHEFVRTGSASPLMQFLGQENTRKIAEAAAAQRQAESAQRLEAERARKEREDAIKSADAQSRINDYLVKAQSAVDEGKDAQAKMYVDNAAQIASAYSLPFSADKYLGEATMERQKKAESLQNRMYLESQLNPQDVATEEDKNMFLRNAAEFHRQGKLNDKDFLDLKSSADKFVTDEAKSKENVKQTYRGITSDKIKKDEEEKQKTIDLARKAQKKLDNKYKLTKSEQDALNKAKEKKWI